MSELKLGSRDEWSDRFERWAKPLSETEDQKCQNAESVVRSALDADSELCELKLQVFAQGSFKANTNIRAESDIDICIRCSNTFFYQLTDGVTARDVSIVPATLGFADYKNKVHRALVNRFGHSEVIRGDKAFNIRENSYRINADVLAAFDYKEYSKNYLGQIMERTGISFCTDSGIAIVNWPEETLANGRSKNVSTGSRYKKVVRVLKNLRCEMETEGIDSAKGIGSFQLACLAYNLSDTIFDQTDLYDAVRICVLDIFASTHEPEQSVGWKEVDELKLLFPPGQSERQKQVAEFFWDVFNYAELKRIK